MLDSVILTRKESPCKYASKMRRLTAEMRNKQRYGFSCLVRMVHLIDQPSPHIIQTVAEKFFADGAINWGRIVSLFVFAHCLARNTPHDFDNTINQDLATGLEMYVNDRLRPWIEANGGWVSDISYHVNTHNSL